MQRILLVLVRLFLSVAQKSFLLAQLFVCRSLPDLLSWLSLSLSLFFSWFGFNPTTGTTITTLSTLLCRQTFFLYGRKYKEREKARLMREKGRKVSLGQNENPLCCVDLKGMLLGRGFENKKVGREAAISNRKEKRKGEANGCHKSLLAGLDVGGA